jgi:hypothetical protein
MHLPYSVHRVVSCTSHIRFQKSEENCAGTHLLRAEVGEKVNLLQEVATVSLSGEEEQALKCRFAFPTPSCLEVGGGFLRIVAVQGESGVVYSGQ